jgi:hypothetical protein
MTYNSFSDSGARPAATRGLRASVSASGQSSHTAHFYSNDPQLIIEIGQRMLAALVGGGAAVIIADQPHRNGIAQYLEARGINLSRIAGQGRWLALDAQKTLNEFMVGSMPDPQRFATLIGGVLDRLGSAVPDHRSEKATVAAFGEMVALLWDQGNSEGSLRLEQLWNDLAASHAFHLSCGWPLRFFSRTNDAQSVDQICSEHTHVTPTPGYDAIGEDERRRGGFLWQLKAHTVLQNVSRITRQTLGFYRESTSPTRVSISEAIDEVLAINGERLRMQEISLRRKIRPSLNIHWTQGEFKQILSNLISNAIDASGDGATIYLSARESRHPVTGAPGLRLCVGDQGTGIPAALCSRVFSPFFASRKDINIGLGLWTVKDLLDKRGGYIRCRSRVTAPSGTLMTAFLPAEPAVRQPVTENHPEQDEAPPRKLA